jgi:hypothetical protein
MRSKVKVQRMAKRKVNLGGTEYMAEEIEFESDGAEKWNLYVLQDGTTLKVKAVLSEVLRVDGMYAPNGDPMYTANAQIVVATSAPEHLKKKD